MWFMKVKVVTSTIEITAKVNECTEQKASARLGSMIFLVHLYVTFVLLCNTDNSS